MFDSSTVRDAFLEHWLRAQQVDYTQNGEDSRTACPPGREEAGQPERLPAAVPLSKAHIRPHVEFRSGASILKAHRGGQKEDQVGGGVRGEITGFSDDSRRRLMYLIGGIMRDASLPLFITLTYPNSFPDARSSKRHLKMFQQRFKRAFPAHGSIWKLEPQKRGAPHYHILTWGLDLNQVQSFVPVAWFKIAGGGDEKHLAWHMGLLGHGNKHCVQRVRSWRGVWTYASKYLGKTFEVEGWQGVGRFWGVVNRENIPFGELHQVEVTRGEAVQTIRYQRRFSKLKKRNNRSLTIFCDVDQWISKLQIGGDECLETG